MIDLSVLVVSFQRRDLLEACLRSVEGLGDLAVRRGDLAQARRDYGMASRLNPREASLRALARDPAGAAG